MAKDYRTAGRTRDEWIALETIDKINKEDQSEAKEIAEMAMRVSDRTDLDPIEALALLMRLGQYFASNAGVKK